MSATLTFAQTHECDITEQYFDCGNNINFIFLRDQNSPPPLNNMLIGIITPTLSSWGIKICHLLRTICWLGKKHKLYLHEGSKFATSWEQYVDWGNNINFIFMRDQHLSPLMTNMLNGVITSMLSSWGIKIRKAEHQLRANVQVAAYYLRSLMCICMCVYIRIYTHYITYILQHII